MTEKELREYAKHKPHCAIEAVGGRQWPDGRTVYCTCGLDQALSQPPDLVAVLRWLREYMLKWGEESWAWNACEPVVLFIRKNFGIRLTDDGGWEYLDSGTANAATGNHGDREQEDE